MALRKQTEDNNQNKNSNRHNKISHSKKDIIPAILGIIAALCVIIGFNIYRNNKLDKPVIQDVEVNNVSITTPVIVDKQDYLKLLDNNLIDVIYYSDKNDYTYFMLDYNTEDTTILVNNLKLNQYNKAVNYLDSNTIDEYIEFRKSEVFQGESDSSEIWERKSIKEVRDVDLYFSTSYLVDSSNISELYDKGVEVVRTSMPITSPKDIHRVNGLESSVHSEYIKDINKTQDNFKSSYKFVSIIILTSSIIMLLIFYKQLKAGSAGSFNPVDKKLMTNTFDDIYGYNETKKELKEIIELVNLDEEYRDFIPKGILLLGEAGTGKTSLARALANELEWNFISANGGDFVKLFVGQGSINIKKLMKSASKNLPCVIFIDELDAIGKRNNGSSGGALEENRTINALLTAMDGFSKTKDILFIGATNLVQNIDESLLRPGRFERHIKVGLPTQCERQMILEKYISNFKFTDDINLESLAKQTAGFSGASLEGLIKLAKVQSLIEKKDIITTQHIKSAMYKILTKGNKREVLDEELLAKRDTIAYHEAGHALANYLLFNKVSEYVTIAASTSDVGGFTICNPEETRLYSRRFLVNQIMVLYAGRVSEQLYNGEQDITAGCSNDIQVATLILRDMILRYGMSSYGLLNLEIETINRQLDIVDEMTRLSDAIYNQIYGIFNNTQELRVALDKIAECLLDKETITDVELSQIINSSDIDRDKILTANHISYIFTNNKNTGIQMSINE